ncbi:hypothetical protein BO71DRAFT_394288 [Aspergillus ellipticus CBS 707.79]|uniref:Uncharacterized protein n=1 Tax=Aspergillus ellipticus CBS 707.79 TaxID=1448320 RepID=A0A319DPH7_9EURO|nr:hypothetical protein BO71DRAFT_394288 [Aspergillus ellipticus CBS 707.79]
MSRIRRLLHFNPQFIFQITPPSPQGPKSPPIHSLRVKRPWVKKALKTIVLSGVAYHLWSYYALLLLNELPDDVNTSSAVQLEPKGPTRPKQFDRNRHPFQPTENDALDSSSYFIPFGWPRLYEGESYKPSDPEWRQFFKISADREKIQLLKDDLKSVVLDNLSQSNLLPQLLGGPLSVTAVWLVHQFPHRAPPTYYRSGLQIARSGITWVSKPMAPEDGDRFHKWINPLPGVLAIGDACFILWRRHVSRFNQRSDEYSQGNFLSSNPHKLDGSSRIQPVSQSSTPKTQEDTSSTRDDPRLHPSFFISILQRLPLPNPGPGSDLHLALSAFKWRLNDCWARKPHTPRRGVFYFSGPVGLKGPKGVCRVEVKGEYDAMASKWRVVSMKLREVNMFKPRAISGRS